jgi:hypothetical protein
MFWRYDIDKNQLGAAYLFLSSENRINDAEYMLFEEMGKSINDFSEMKGEIIGECEKALSQSGSGKSRFDIVSEIFSTNNFSMSSSFDMLYTILWALTSLQYNLESKSDKKQQLIELFAEKNNIDKSIVLEMRDICETQSAIIKYQEWLKTGNNMTYLEIDSIVQEFNKNLKNMEQSVSDLIALG